MKGRPSSSPTVVPTDRHRRPRAKPNFLLSTVCGHLRIPAGGRLLVSLTLNRVLVLSVAMLLCVGVLMALDAPRTLGLLVVLMLLLEAMVLAAAALASLNTLWHRARRRSRRSGRPPRNETGQGPTLQWWTYEAALLLLIAAWMTTR